MKINSRTVNFYEVHLHTNSKSKDVEIATQTPMSQMLPLLATKIPAQYEIKYGNTPIEVTQARWQKAKGELHLLLNIADPDRSDVTYRKRQIKARRPGNKGADEDIELSSHVVVRAVPGAPVAKVAMTAGAGIPPGKIVSLLRDIYKMERNSTQLAKLIKQPLPIPTLSHDGKMKTFEVSHSFQLNGMPNSTLLDIINGGKIVGLDLIDTGSYEFDSTSNLAVDRMQIHLNLENSAVDFAFIRRVLGLAKTSRNFDADKVRIEYTDKSGPSERVKHKLFTTSQLQEAFTRSETIELQTRHNDHQSVISDEIIQLMSELI